MELAYDVFVRAGYSDNRPQDQPDRWPLLTAVAPNANRDVADNGFGR